MIVTNPMKDTDSENNDEVIILHTRFICTSCKNEMKKPIKGCQFCDGKEYVQLINRNRKEESKIEEILERMKNEVEKK